MPNTSSPPKLLLIGWDAADWRMIHPLIDEGKMPYLARLIEEGTSGNLATLQPVLSPMLWTSIGTGKRPYKHGVHGFSEPDPVTGAIRPVTNLSRKTKAVWNILNQENLNSLVVGWWPSHPAEPLTKGVMVSNHYQRATGKSFDDWKMQPGCIHPERLESVLREIRFHPTEADQELLFTFLPALQAMDQEGLDKVHKDPRLKSLMKVIADATTVHSAATALMQNEPWDFAAVYYDAIDHFGHGFMKYHPPRREWIPEEDFAVWKDVMESGYRYHDLMLGTLLHLAGDDTTVVLMSDHGFHPDHMRPRSIPHEPAGPAAEHRQFGILAAKGPGIRKDATIFGANLLDICPTILHHFGRPVGEDMDGKVLLDLYENPTTPDTIPSWDEIEGEDGSHPADKQIAPADSKAALDQLVALGYIEEPGADKQKALDQTVRELDFNLAGAYIDAGIFTEAILILERLYAKWPMEHRLGVKLTACYQALGRISDLREVTHTIIKRRVEEAHQAAEELKALNLDDPDARRAEQEKVEAMSDQEKQKFQRERQELISKARPNLFSLHYLDAFADFSEKKYDDALKKLEQLDEDYGARRNALSLRGDIHLRRRDWNAARAAYREALEIDAESPGPRLGLARADLGERNFTAAADHARASIGLLYHQPRAHYLLGLALYREGNWENAEQAFLASLKQAPLMAMNYRMLSEIARYHKNEPAEAAQFRQFARDARRRLREEKQRDRAAAAAPLESPRAGTEDDAPMPELLPRPDALKDIPPEEIITVVTGLPRSGTSLMMQMLDAAGIPAFADDHRPADHSNPRGYFEHERVAALLKERDKSWLADARGKAIKVVAPLLSALPPRIAPPVGRVPSPGATTKPSRLHYRVLFMDRPMEEILDSQQKMLDRLDHPTAAETREHAPDIARAFRQQIHAARAALARRGTPALEVNYHALIENPAATSETVATFLNALNNASAMAVRIDPNLYRSRS